ncbi:MAG: YigZ family protein [Ignavibacteriales bacterium]|nr:YigZ family protein [Ignavibacteriales bacterium]
MKINFLFKMNLPEKIKTIVSPTEFKLKEKGSIFIAKSFPIISEDDANNLLNQQRKEFYDATHHCYSYKLQNRIFKYSDDGEPNGTAGIRIFNAQNHFELTNILTIVIRYFGGTKLGVGPLGKAYYESAFNSINQNEIIEKELYQNIVIEYDFSQSKTVHHLINKNKIRIQTSTFEEIPKIFAIIKPNILKQFEDEVNFFSPQIRLKIVDEYSYQ